MARFKDYDDYIDQCEPFAKPILTIIRQCVHEACPEVQEEFKWSFPNFTYKGAILCHMAGFKKHVSFGFWLGTIMDDPEGIIDKTENAGMGHFGKISSEIDLPSRETLIKYILHAKQLTDDGRKLTFKEKRKPKPVIVPDQLKSALAKNQLAREVFEKFSPSNQREYSEWITDAKTEKTVEKRIIQAIEWISEGKPRNWKYMKKWKP